MLREKALWLFAGGPMQVPAARYVVEKGYRLVVTDRNPDCECAEYADEVIEMDTFDIENNIRAAESISEKFIIDAVFTVAADCHETVARVGSFLNLPTIDPEISRICRYKHICRRVLKDTGIPQPEVRVASNLEQARDFVMQLGGTAALKATNNSGSRGFVLIRDIEELDRHVFDYALSAGTTGYVIVEQILRPVENEIAELSVETLWYKGKMYWLNWVDRLFRNDFLFFDSLRTDIYSDVSWGVEIGHINPAVHDDDLKKKVSELIWQSGITLGMHTQPVGHVLKADIMLTGSGPVILELTPRLSGGWDSSGSTPARGANFIGGVIELALGRELDDELYRTFFNYANPDLYATVLALIGDNAKDCIGRQFAIGTDYSRNESIKKSLANLTEGNYVIPLEQQAETCNIKC